MDNHPPPLPRDIDSIPLLKIKSVTPPKSLAPSPSSSPKKSFFQDNAHIIKDDVITHHAIVSTYKDKYANKNFHSDINIFIPSDHLFSIFEISPELKYDTTRRILSAHRDNIMQNIILLYFGIQIANGNMTSIKIIKDNLVQKYFDGHTSYSKIKADLIHEFNRNHSKYTNT